MPSNHFNYTIQSGDTLSKIANEINASSGITYQQIQAANPEIDAASLQIGQILNIPTASGNHSGLRYTVQPGDSFSKIAKIINEASGVTYQQIESNNPNLNPVALAIGQIISIPLKDSTSSIVNTPKAAPIAPQNQPQESTIIAENIENLFLLNILESSTKLLLERNEAL